MVDVERTVKEKIGGKRYGEVRNFKKVRKFASSNLKFRSSKFKFTEILICNPGYGVPVGKGAPHNTDETFAQVYALPPQMDR